MDCMESLLNALSQRLGALGWAALLPVVMLVSTVYWRVNLACGVPLVHIVSTPRAGYLRPYLSPRWRTVGRGGLRQESDHPPSWLLNLQAHPGVGVVRRSTCGQRAACDLVSKWLSTFPHPRSSTAV